MVTLVIPPKGVGITGLERDQNTGHSDQSDHLLLVIPIEPIEIARAYHLT